LEVGFDGNKQVKGRKRHIIVDILGLVLGCFVSAANVADIKAAPAIWLWALERFSRISKILGDRGYRSIAKAEQLKSAYGCELEISLRHEQGFEVEPKRWIVERTLAWLDNARALCRDYEGLPENHEGMVYVVMIRLMLRRLCRNRRTRGLTKQQKRESVMLN
jgi:transposase